MNAIDLKPDKRVRQRCLVIVRFLERHGSQPRVVPVSGCRTRSSVLRACDTDPNGMRPFKGQVSHTTPGPFCLRAGHLTRGSSAAERQALNLDDAGPNPAPG